MVKNLRTYSFEEWLDFVFYHPNDDNDWSFDDEWEYTCDGGQLVDYMSILFSSAEEILINKFSFKEIDRGFWFITGVNGFMWVFLDESIPWKSREDCLFLIPKLFSELYAKYDIGSSGYMWWDSFVTYCAYKDRNLGTDLRILRSVVKIIKRMLSQDCEIARESAKHGIVHLLRVADTINDDSVKNFIYENISTTKDELLNP